jgi:hypothetical protein
MLTEPEGTTPLSDGDLVGLKPTWVATRADLDEVEQTNIAKAALWCRPPGAWDHFEVSSARSMGPPFRQ